MAEGGVRSKGIVKWFDNTKGFGFITPENGNEDIFVHQSSIKATGFRSLSDGEAVEYIVETGSDGKSKASDVTGPNGANVSSTLHGRGGGEGKEDGGGGHNGVSRRGFGPVCMKCNGLGHYARDCRR